MVEATYNWGPVYDWLDELVDDVVLAHPTKVRAIAEARIKNDRLDSETLAQLLRADLIPEAHAPSKETRAIKRVLRQCMFFRAGPDDGEKLGPRAPHAARDPASGCN